MVLIALVWHDPYEFNDTSDIATVWVLTYGHCWLFLVLGYMTKVLLAFAVVLCCLSSTKFHSCCCLLTKLWYWFCKLNQAFLEKQFPSSTTHDSCLKAVAHINCSFWLKISYSIHLINVDNQVSMITVPMTVANDYDSAIVAVGQPSSWTVPELLLFLQAWQPITGYQFSAANTALQKGVHSSPPKPTCIFTNLC